MSVSNPSTSPWTPRERGVVFPALRVVEALYTSGSAWRHNVVRTIVVGAVVVGDGSYSAHILDIRIILFDSSICSNSRHSPLSNHTVSRIFTVSNPITVVSPTPVPSSNDFVSSLLFWSPQLFSSFRL